MKSKIKMSDKDIVETSPDMKCFVGGFEESDQKESETESISDN